MSENAPDVRATRRALLGLALAGPAMLGAARALAADAGTCVNLDDLPASEKSMRQALNFMLISDDASRHCAICAFYSAGEGDCGKCQIFNGPVPAQGRCDSWAARK